MKSRSTRSSKSGKPVLSSVALAVLATLIAGGVQAQAVTGTTLASDQSSSITDGTATSGAQILENKLNNDAYVSSSIYDSQGVIFTTGGQTASSNVITANQVSAQAIGNNASGTIDASLRSTTSVNGLAVHSVSVNDGSVSTDVIFSGVNGNVYGSSSDGSTLVANKNTVSATTTVNNTIATISGVTSAGVASSAQGSTTVDYKNPTDASQNVSAATGDLVVTTVQQNNGTGGWQGSSAFSEGNFANVEQYAWDNSTFGTLSSQVKNNAFATTFTGNAAANTVSLQAGGAPAYAGSIAVSNLQSQGQQDTNTFINGSAYAYGTQADSWTVLDNWDNTAGPMTSSVTGNTMSAAATANQAGNAIVLGNGLSFTGNGGATALTTASFSNGNDPVQASVTADLVLLNNQNNVNGAITTQAFGQQIYSYMAAAGTSFTQDVSSNVITSAANGNVASNSITTGAGGATASFTGTAALLNQQGSTNASVEADLYGSYVAASSDLWSNGANLTTSNTATVNSNVMSATALGNQVNQSLSLNATTLTPTGAAVALTSTTGNWWDSNDSASASGFATVVNVQNSASAPVSAYNMYSEINANTYNNSLVSNTLTVDGNAQRAIAGGSSAGNALSLTGTTVGSGAGVLNLQVIDNASPVTAGLGGAETGIFVNGDLNTSGLAVTKNLQLAFAYGASANNTLSVTANALVLPAENITAASEVNYFGTPAVTAAYAILNNQSTNADINASTTSSGNGNWWWGGNGSIGITTYGSVNTSGLKTDGNTLVAAAYGNDANSTLTMALNNVPAAGSVSVADVTSVQSIDGSNIVASATGDQVIGIQIRGDILNSKVSTSSNAIEAVALGNRATNQLTVTANGVDTSDFNFNNVTYAIPYDQVVNSAFNVQNVQSAYSTLTATQVMVDGPANSIGITTGYDYGNGNSYGSQIANSSVTANLNLSVATATANTATNGLSLTVNNAATTSAVENIQTSRSNVSALIGQASTSGAGGSDANQGGVTLAFAGSGVSITNSMLSVSDNVTSGSVTDNLATNSLTVVGNSIASATGNYINGAEGAYFGSAAAADHVVVNAQQSSSSLNSDVYGSFGIDLSNKATIANSTLSVVGNIQASSAVANSVNNALTLGNAGTTSVASTSALANSQTSWFSDVTASSNLDLFTPAGAIGSTVAITGNTNSAVAVVNQAVNTLTVAGTNVSSVSNVNAFSPSGLYYGYGDAFVSADHSLSNQQFTVGAVSSFAQTNVYNNEADSNPDASVLNGSVTVGGNITVAQAYANTAVNTLSVTGSASQGASAGLANSQVNYGWVNATAITTGMVALTVTSNDSQTLDSSSVAFTGNSTTAVARGNAANNTLVMNAGASYDTASTSATSGVGGPFVVANAVVQNTQFNGGSVSANSYDTTYQVALNNGVSANNSSINVSDNSVTALAYGNSATNSITLTALNTGTPTAAVSNYQVNTGSVTATVSSAYYGSGITGGASGTAVRVSGNQVTASAVGNSVVSSIVASR